MFGLSDATAMALVGLGTAFISTAMTWLGFRQTGRPLGHWLWASGLAGAILGSAVYAALQLFEVQLTAEVRPDRFWQDFRVISHAILAALLVAATCTDLDDYYIPDIITVPGMLAGVVLATVSGDLQVAHVWVDWNEAIPQIRGPYLPGWLSTHPHLHGLAWSLAGLVCGMTLSWMVRAVARSVMGVEALGFGDVMLMGMVGSFLGWQPTTVAFLLAPLCAIAIGLAVRLVTGRSYIPYGPYLAAGSLMVIFGWRWIWMFEFRLMQAAGPNDREGVFAMRRLFGDWISLLVLLAMMIAGLVLLLGLGRLYRMIPGRTAAAGSATDD